MELIPAIDLKEGRCVRLFKGEFEAATVYSYEPQSVLDSYRALGARRVHVVDLDGARDGGQPNRAVILQLTRCNDVRLQVGGGLRSLDRVRDVLAGGAARAVIGSVAVTAPDEVIAWFAEIDCDRIVLALDVRLDGAGAPLLTTHGWRQTSTETLWSAVERYARVGVRHVLCTDVDRDGALTGPNFELYAEAVRRFPALQWQASGGVASARDLAVLRQCGVAAAISGKALLEHKIAPEELRPFLPSALFPVSM
jgi:phosphoribosylformimino-5-aminoimidazole carboxamide ribotide isomerase